jgi:MFS family permease
VNDYRMILLLAVLSGVGNSVIHPADYAILAGSVRKEFMGRAFALHTFTGNLGFALAPPTVALLLLVMDWRGALLLVGLLGVPVVGAILWQSRVLTDQPKARASTTAEGGARLLTSRPILAFFAFFLLSAMAGSGVTAFLITVLGVLWGTPIALASIALTGYMAGATGGTLIGGWWADKKGGNLLGFVFVLTGISMALILSLGLVDWGEWLLLPVALLAGLCLGASRTPRDVMLKEACPPGEIGKVFGFVSAGLPLGSALMPVPMGFMIDLGFAWAVLPVVAVLLGLSLLCAGAARGMTARVAPRMQPAE